MKACHTDGVRSRVETVVRWFGLGEPGGVISSPPVPDVQLLPGQILLLTGPSGAGKSTLFRRLRRRFSKERWLDLGAIPLARRPVIDLFPTLALQEALGLLSRVGLAEAHTYTLAPHRLSAGQQSRLRLALALARVADAGGPICLACDEFAALLDRVTAAVLAHALRKTIARSANLCAILATSHDDLQAALCPDIVIRCDFGEVAIEYPNRP